jgi:hypothetical protein
VISRPLSKRIEEGFGWMNTAGELAQVRVRAAFVFAVAAYDIVRLPKFLAPGGRVSGDMKSKSTMTRRQTKTLKMSRAGLQKTAAALLLRKRCDLFSRPAKGRRPAPRP